MKICIIGNSHIASLKLGWDEIAPLTPAQDITFFAARGKQAAELVVKTDWRRRKTLVPGIKGGKLERSIEFTSGGKTEIDFSAYDICMLHGLLKFPRYDRRISAAVKQAVMQRSVVGSLATPLVAKIRACSDIPIWISHQPVPRLQENEFIPATARYAPYDMVLDEITAAFGRDDVRFLAQPKETLASEIATQGRYSQGSVRLDVGDKHSNKPHEVEDYVHMNGAYGVLVLNALFAANDS